MADGVTYAALERLTKMPNDNDPVSGDRIAGQYYYDVNFVGGDISGVTLTDVIINGSETARNERVVTAAGDVTVVDGDYVITMNKAVAEVTTITLPASPTTSRSIIVKDGKGDATSFNITIDGNGQTIDGAATLVVSDNYGAVEIIYNGTEWNAIGEYGNVASGVTSVNGQTGVVILDTDDISEGATNLYFTTERAQDATGAMVDQTIVYDDVSNGLSRAAITGDITIAQGQNVSAITAGAIVDADINVAAAIDATKIADGSVNNTEFEQLSGIGSNIQVQLNGKQAAIQFQDHGVNIGTQGAETVLNFTGLGATVTEVGGTVTLDVTTGGDVIGPATSTDNAIARYDGITGNYIQDSGATIDDLGNISATNLSGTNTGDQTTITGNAGSATILQTGRTIGITGDLTYTSPSFNGSANVTAAGTLATVNANVGSFGSATQVGTFTVNGKGLVTAASNTAIQIAESQVTNLVTDLALKAPLASPTFTGTVTLPAGQVVNGVTLTTAGSATNFLNEQGNYVAGGGGSGTVTSVSVVTANGVSGSVANATTTPAITLVLGAITPSAINSPGNIVGANLTGVNTGDQTTITGNAGTATTLQTIRTFDISGSTGLTAAAQNFNGSANVSLPLTGTLVAANGGTGQTTYAIGDLLYASSSSALSKLAMVATNNVLRSGGLGSPPVWGKVALAGDVSGTLPVANGGTGITSFGAGIATFLGTPTSANLAAAVTNETGSGSLVFATSPTLVTPILGTPTSGTLTNCTGLPISTGVSGLGTGVATFLATPSSANLATAVTDETGTGALVFAGSPVLTGTPTAPTAAVGTNTTQLATTAFVLANTTVLGTAVASTSGTSIDFTSIPSSVREITVMFNGVSTNGASCPIIQLGTSGGFQTTGYSGSGAIGATISNLSTGFSFGPPSNQGAANVRHGKWVISYLGSSNTWISTMTGGFSDTTNSVYSAGSVTLGGTLDRVRITTVGGTDTFDLGNVNISMR